MNIQRIPEFLLRWGVTLIGILLALFLAKSLGDGKSGMVATVLLGLLGVIVTLVLREYVWVLIPVFWPLIGKVEALAVPFMVRDIITMYVFVSILSLVAFKIVRRSPNLGLVDIVFIFNVIWVVATFVRNPVGFESTDSARVGGRPYFDAFIGCLAFWVLSRSSGSPKLIRLVPWFVLTSVGVIFLLNVAINIAPNIAPYIAPFYSGFDLGAYAELDSRLVMETGSAGRRYEMFQEIGKQMTLILCAYSYPPHLLAPYRFRFYIAAATFFGQLLSGFRSLLIFSGGIFFLGTAIRRGFSRALAYVGIALLAVIVVLLGHGTVYELPFAAQRALGFLPEAVIPARLDPLAVEAGESSTRWRTEMWIEALTTNRYIESHWFGDGFGLSKTQLNTIGSMQYRANSFRETQETMATVGEFHSGPVSSIRVVGYIGLALFYFLMILLARDAYRLIRRTRNTPFFEPTLFFCMPIVFEPFWFTFVFGGFPAAIPFAGLGLGVIKLLQNSVGDWEAECAKNPVPALADVTPPIETATERVRL